MFVNIIRMSCRYPGTLWEPRKNSKNYSLFFLHTLCMQNFFHHKNFKAKVGLETNVRSALHGTWKIIKDLVSGAKLIVLM